MKTADKSSRKQEFNDVSWSLDHIPRVSCSSFCLMLQHYINMFFCSSESTFTTEFVYFLHLSLDIYVLAVWFFCFLFNMKYGYSIVQI